MRKGGVHIITNEAKVLFALYNEKLTRSEIAKITGLGYSSVNYIVFKLETLGLIKRVGMKKVKSGPIEDVYGITEKGINVLKRIILMETPYIDILLKVKKTVLVTTET
jgi:DNA-binding MarR family transcriptional regulator